MGRLAPEAANDLIAAMLDAEEPPAAPPDAAPEKAPEDAEAKRRKLLEQAEEFKKKQED